jgi:glutamate N-acetyltransferase / amino-acid N-acetyltransferase
MPVNLTAPDPASLLPVAGVRLGIASAGIKKPGRRDLTLIELRRAARWPGCSRRTASAPRRSRCANSISAATPSARW